MNRRINLLEHQASQMVRQIITEDDPETRRQLVNEHFGLRLKIDGMRKAPHGEGD